MAARVVGASPSEEERTAVREYSHRLFNSWYRIEVGAAIHENKLEPLSAKQIAEATGIDYPRVHTELKRLRSDLVLLEAFSSSSSEKMWKPLPHPLWEFCAWLLREHGSTTQPGGKRRSA